MREEHTSPLETTLAALAKIPDLINLQELQSKQIQSLTEAITEMKNHAKDKKVNNKLCYTVKDAAAMLGVCVESVRRKIRSGELKTILNYRKRLIIRESLEDFIRKGTMKPYTGMIE